MADAPPVEIRALTKRYGSTVAVDDLSFSIGAGRITGFLGPNGAGKTSTLRALLGLVRPTSGEALVEGQPYAQLSDPLGTVGAVLEADSFHPARSGRNHLRVLATAAGVPSARVDTVLGQVELSGAARRRVGGYSLGMRQRLSVAGALLGRPRLLVLDEPANGLDPAGTRHVHRVLTGLAARGTAVVLSSHRMDDLAALCSEVTILATGRVVFSGPLAKLVADGDELDYRLRTSDPAAARRVAAETPDLVVLADDDRHELVVRGAVPVLDDLVARLVGAGVGVREFAPVVAPLEAAFLALTEES